MKPDGYHMRLGLSGGSLATMVTGPAGNLSLAPDIGRSGGKLDIIDLGVSGLLLGFLFDRSGNRVRRVEAETARSWCQSGGATLLAGFWGSYLAILRCGPETLVLRDPSGGFPCYWMRRPDGLLLASDMAWADAGGASQPGIDWTEIHAQLYYRHRRSCRTALRGVAELLPGCALRIEKDHITSEAIWSPYNHARWEEASRFDDAVHKVRGAVERVLSAEAQLWERPLIALSGGLDSSIVTAGIASRNPATQGLTFRGGDADLDESRYAQAVADRYGILLHRELLDPALVDLRHCASADLPYPTARSFAQADDAQARKVAEQIGADAFILGNGGDNIFWYFNTATAAVDRLKAQGPTGFLRTVSDLAHMCEVPRRTVFALAVRKLVRRTRQPWPGSGFLLSREAGLPAIVPPHPWEDAPVGTPLGVHAYVRALIQLQDHHGYFDRAAFAPVRSVLIAQPIIEACLGIPSWLSAKDGRNRAVARAAFADLLPPVTTTRQSKGGFDGFVHQMLAGNISLVRDMLLGGMLSERGFLDTGAIATLFRQPAAISGEAGLRLLRLVAVEAWLASQRTAGRG